MGWQGVKLLTLACLALVLSSLVGCGEKPQPAAAPVTANTKLPPQAGGQQLSHP